MDPKAFKPEGVECILIDEAQIKIGDKEAWVWLAFEPYRKAFLGFHISFTRNSLDAWIFLKRLRRRYGFKPIYTNGGSWYPLACKWARLRRYRYSKEWQNLMERAIQALMITFLAGAKRIIAKPGMHGIGLAYSKSGIT
ncbi:MAG: DDE-type integrase/transposase/recombinase [Candidatus Bathyarchaeia archaeon]